MKETNASRSSATEAALYFDTKEDAALYRRETGTGGTIFAGAKGAAIYPSSWTAAQILEDTLGLAGELIDDDDATTELATIETTLDCLDWIYRHHAPAARHQALHEYATALKVEPLPISDLDHFERLDAVAQYARRHVSLPQHELI